jgi:hypothetical protein
MGGGLKEGAGMMGEETAADEEVVGGEVEEEYNCELRTKYKDATAHRSCGRCK